MPTRAHKRKQQELDPTKSDSDDETYEDTAKRPARQRSAQARPKKAKKKSKPSRKRRDDESDESELEGTGSDEDDDEDDDIEDFAPEEPVELDERTGRPKRSSRKKPVRYQETDDEDDLEEIEEPEEHDEPEQQPRQNSKHITLKLKTPQQPSSTSTRTMRAGSMSRGRRRQSSEPLSAGIRRSGRLHPEEQETLMKLTDSGQHVEIVRPGTRSPEGVPRRAIRGGKSLPGPAVSAIHEQEEEHEDEAGDEQRLRPKDEEEDEFEAAEDVEDEGEGPKAAQEPGAGPIRAVGRQRVGSGNDDGIPSVEDSDPEREQEMARSASRRSREQEGQGSPAHEVPEEDRIVMAQDDEEDDDADDPPISNGRRTTTKARASREDPAGGRTSKKRRRPGADRPSSDHEFNPDEAEDDDDEVSGSEESPESQHEELEELRERRPKRRRLDEAERISYEKTAPRLRRRTAPIDYRLIRPDLPPPEEMEVEPAHTPSRRGRGGAQSSYGRALFSTSGPFGRAGGPPPVFGGQPGLGATGGVDSDSSDDERAQRLPAQLVGVGMTPTTALGSSLLPVAQAHNSDPVQGTSATTANLGKIKDRKALADADPLGVDQNITFESVGGLQGHINQLKEMVTLPLLYPEIFQRYHLTPPRGVLFHGPPGTGKTLLARALAATVSSQGQKITFYMRKGADALSKWVGEAERQLRLLFEEARANQPSIIFFDEIDGLAPVRSSKQEQIHASIVSTLLALMDGMDGRGQVIVIGATNRPDSVDPALRRPGRFDREFYFPLPDKDARRSILDIHTKDWKPPLSTSFKDQLADMTKGYGGADLRALCTEAALNAVQRRYPQIYKSNEKLKIDPSTINVTARDFFISLKSMVPSSERTVASGAAPLPKQIEPLLRRPLSEIQNLLTEILPRAKKLTALEEAEFEDYPDPDGGLQRERLQQDLETSRVFRPRLLIRGLPGMGQQYLANALLNQFEGLHVQSFDLPTLLSDPTKSPEAAIVQLFAEVRRRKPSVIFIPNVDSWYQNVGSTIISTFLSLLRTLAPTDPVLLLGIIESEPSTKLNPRMMKDLFGFSKKNQYQLDRPDKPARKTYFQNVADYIRKSPNDFPDPSTRKKRKLEQLEVAPPPSPRPTKRMTKEERDMQKKKDRLLLNLLRLRIQPTMDAIKKKYRRFHTSIVEDDQIRYLYEEENAENVHTDVPEPQRARPFEKAVDANGVPGLRETSTGKFFYNLNLIIIEERLANGYYMRPQDFLADIRTLAKDAKTHGGDRERETKAKQLLAEVEVDVWALEQEPTFAECENIYQRELAKIREREEKLAGKAPPAEAEAVLRLQTASNAATMGSTSTSGLPSLPPGTAAEAAAGLASHAQMTPLRTSEHSSLSNGFSAGPGNIGDPHAPGADAQNGFARPTGPYRTETPLPSQPTQQYAVTGSQPERAGVSQQSGALTQRSQKSLITAMPPGSQLEDFVNDASTTTSGKKTSMDRSSDRFNTESSNSVGGSLRRDVPDFSGVESKVHGDSQLPSTQQEIPSSQGSVPHVSSQQSSQKSSRPASQQQPPVPPFNAAAQSRPSIHALLNNDSQANLVVDQAFISHLHEQLTERTSGCSIEQLEQVNTALTDCIWKQRREWNRTIVAHEVRRVFNEVMADIEEMQNILPASLDPQEFDE